MSTFATLWRTWIATSEGLSARVLVRRLSATPWNRPAAPGRPAGARPQRGPRVNLLNWRANWRLSSRGRFWLRSWGKQIESPPGYSVPPSIEMDSASRCILAPRQVATESAVEGACGPHVFVVVFASSDWALGCTSPTVFIVKMDGRVRGWWWGTSEYTMIFSTLMVRFGVGMGRANSMFVISRQGRLQAASRLPSSHLKVTVKHRQECLNASTSTSDIRLRPCASRPPWNRRIVSGRCAGARPHRGPRVNLLEFGEGQLACFLSRCPP
ncbi:hypothetical protein EV122DRAFT_291227 [Schizophyllum commune]